MLSVSICSNMASVESWKLGQKFVLRSFLYEYVWVVYVCSDVISNSKKNTYDFYIIVVVGDLIYDCCFMLFVCVCLLMIVLCLFMCFYVSIYVLMVIF